jgi:hypothetical protein
LPFDQGEQFGQADFMVEGKANGPGAVFLERAMSHSASYRLEHHGFDNRSRFQRTIDDELDAAARNIPDARGIEEMVAGLGQLKPGSDVGGKSNMLSAIGRTCFGHHKSHSPRSDEIDRSFNPGFRLSGVEKPAYSCPY